jgi:photoactive yellow protein
MHSFTEISIRQLSLLDAPTLDALDFGVIGLARDGSVTIYNATESAAAGLSSARVIGEQFFSDIAQCMNNFLVAQRFEDEPELDDTIDFTLTFRMRPTPVKLRMLQSAEVETRFVLIKRILS